MRAGTWFPHAPLQGCGTRLRAFFAVRNQYTVQVKPVEWVGGQGAITCGEKNRSVRAYGVMLQGQSCLAAATYPAPHLLHNCRDEYRVVRLVGVLACLS